MAIRLPKDPDEIQREIDARRSSIGDMDDFLLRRRLGLDDRSGNLIPEPSSSQLWVESKKKSQLTEELAELEQHLKKVNSEYEDNIARLKQEREDRQKAVGSIVGRLGGPGAAGAAGGVQEIMSGRGGAAGMASGALAIAQGVADSARAVIGRVSRDVELSGEFMARVAKNDGFGMITAAADKAANALGAIPIVGGLAGDALKSFASGLNVAKAIVDSFAERGRELAKYNGIIAAADAETRVNKILADISEANRLGPQYADMIRAQGKLDLEWQKAMVDLKKELLPIAMSMAKMLTGLVQTMATAMKVDWKAAIAGGVMGVGAAIEIVGRAQKESLDEIAKAQEDMVKLLGGRVGLAGLLDLTRDGANVNQQRGQKVLGTPLPAPFARQP